MIVCHRGYSICRKESIPEPVKKTLSNSRSWWQISYNTKINVCEVSFIDCQNRFNNVKNKIMKDIKKQIEELKAMLTGDLFQDGDILQKIYELKKELNPEIENNPELDEDEDGCLYCGS